MLVQHTGCNLGQSIKESLIILFNTNLSLYYNACTEHSLRTMDTYEWLKQLDNATAGQGNKRTKQFSIGLHKQRRPRYCMGKKGTHAAHEGRKRTGNVMYCDITTRGMAWLGLSGVNT